MATSITAQAEALLRGPTRNAAQEQSNSAYESLWVIEIFATGLCSDPFLISRYDMYASESKHASTVMVDPGKEHGLDGIATQEGTAVEVIEMANGETIWYVPHCFLLPSVELHGVFHIKVCCELSARRRWRVVLRQ